MSHAELATNFSSALTSSFWNIQLFLEGGNACKENKEADCYQEMLKTFINHNLSLVNCS